MGEVICHVCKKQICKYEMDFNACGGKYPFIKELDEQVNICWQCSRDIALEFVENAE